MNVYNSVKCHLVLGWSLYCVITTQSECAGRDDEPYVHKNWKVQHWAENSKHFNYDRHSGRLRVMQGGMYYVYAQV